GDSVTFTATVTVTGLGSGQPGGTVTFFDGPVGTNSLGSRTLDGTGHAVLTLSSLSVGPHTINARYDGNSSFNISSGSVAQSVHRGSTTMLRGASSPPVFGQFVTFTPTVAGTGPGSGTPTDSVTFCDGPVNPGMNLGTKTLSGGSATLTTGALSVATH